MFYSKEVVDLRNNVNYAAPENSININEIFIEKIMENIISNAKILDIGTGNGFILNQIKNKTNIPVELYGIDNSIQMVEECQKLEGIKVSLGDNYNIPFNDETFNFVTAKNVTRFSANEIYRVLKPGGKFFFREYGKYKGLVEISKLFEGRLIRSRDYSFYTQQLLEAGFKDIMINQISLKRVYSTIESVLDVVKSYPYIENYSFNDEKKIVDYLKLSKDNLVITSDPFIIIGGKV